MPNYQALLGVSGAISVQQTYEDVISAMSPLTHWPLTETTGTAAANLGTLGAAANGTYESHVKLAKTPAPGGGMAPYWNATSSTEQVDIYSTALNAAFNGQLFSIAIWWQVASSALWTDGYAHYVLDIGVDSSQHVWIQKRTNNGVMQNRSISSEVLSSGHAETSWIFTVLTMSKAANQFKVFENGSQVGTTQTVPDTWTGALGASNCHIGDNRTLGYPWFGYISRVSIWDRVLSPTEITALYQAGQYFDPSTPALNAPSALTIPTYDGSNQPVHPSVYYNSAGWNSKKYWMVMTPYPNDNTLLENPSIVCSNDAATWTVPAGLTNPIYAYTPDGPNSDPELTMVGGTTLYVTFRDFDNNVTWTYKQMSSTDGVTWSAAADLFTVVKPNEECSPTIVYANGKYYMFTVLYIASTQTTSIRRRECATINGTWSDPTDVTCTMPNGAKPWHIGAIKKSAEEKLVMVISTLDRNYLYKAESLDYGLTWNVASAPLMSKSAAPDWDDYALYRSCLTEEGANFYLWYSAASAINSPLTTWGIGRVNLGAI